VKPDRAAHTAHAFGSPIPNPASGNPVVASTSVVEPVGFIPIRLYSADAEREPHTHLVTRKFSTYVCPPIDGQWPAVWVALRRKTKPW
jgi:hypothetical protein